MSTLGATEDGRAIEVDLQTLVESRLLLVANSGGGKSWLIRRLLEQTHGQIQHIVLDVEGEFHTLRERFDYILARPIEGDCVAHPKTAKLLAHKLLELKVSAIVDIYELKSHERMAFARTFLDALVNAPKRLWHPALIIVDEAHVFCPEKGRAESAGAVIDLMTRGRKRGFCGVLATQRIAKLHKDAAAEANNKLIGRCNLDIDMRRAADELGFSGREQQHQLRALRPGQFFAFGPALSDTVEQMTVDTVETTHPRAGERTMEPPPPSENVRRALAQLTELPQQAEQEARDVADLRKENTRLKKALARRTSSAEPDEQALAIADQRGYDRGWSDGCQRNNDLQSYKDELLKVIKRGHDQAKALEHVLDPDFLEVEPASPTSNKAAGARPKTATQPMPAASSRGAQNGKLSKAAAEILQVACTRHPVKLSWGQITTMLRRKARGGYFNTAKRTILDNGFAVEDAGKVVPTDDAFAALGIERRESADDMLAIWLECLPEPAKGILATVTNRGHGIEKEEVARELGLTPRGGYWNTGMRTVRDNDLVIDEGGILRPGPAVDGDLVTEVPE